MLSPVNKLLKKTFERLSGGRDREIKEFRAT